MRGRRKVWVLLMFTILLVLMIPFVVSDAAEFTLLEGTPLVTTDAATSVGSTTATLNGTLDFDAEENCYYSFEYGTVSGVYAYNTEPWHGPITEPDTFDYDLTGLYPGTTYYYRARCYNAYATGYGSEVSFATTMDDPTIITNAASDISISTAKLRSYLASDGGETDPVGTACGFEYDGAVERYCAGEDASREIYTNYVAAQTVTATDDYELSAIGLKLYAEDGGSLPSEVLIGIFGLDAPLPGGHPDIGDPGSYTFYSTDGITGSTDGAWYLVDIPPVGIGSSDEFAVVIASMSGDTNNCIHWLTDESSATYDDGTLQTSIDNGSSWTTHSTYDTMFALFAGGIDYCVMEYDDNVEIYADNWEAQIFTTSQAYAKMIAVNVSIIFIYLFFFF